MGCNAILTHCLLSALVVAYAITGSMTTDITSEPLGRGQDGQPVFLRDIWPSAAEVEQISGRVYTPEVFAEKYADVFDGGEIWDRLPRTPSALFDWQPDSTYVRRPPYSMD